MYVPKESYVIAKPLTCPAAVFHLMPYLALVNPTPNCPSHPNLPQLAEVTLTCCWTPKQEVKSHSRFTMCGLTEQAQAQLAPLCSF